MIYLEPGGQVVHGQRHAPGHHARHGADGGRLPDPEAVPALGLAQLVAQRLVRREECRVEGEVAGQGHRYVSIEAFPPVISIGTGHNLNFVSVQTELFHVLLELDSKNLILIDLL